MARAAGDFPRIRDPAGVGALMHGPGGEQYGPSHAAFQRWKQSGIPTSELMPTQQSFGLSTRKGETAADAISGIPAPPLPNYARLAAGRRVNPITWQGDEAPPPPSSYPSSQPSPLRPSQLEQQQQQPWSQIKPQPSPQLSPDEMHQTWSTLMRTGKARGQQSAAQCMIDMPPAYSLEAQAPRPAIDSQSLMTIGLHPANGGRQVRRSTQFTSDFRDPFN